MLRDPLIAFALRNRGTDATLTLLAESAGPTQDDSISQAVFRQLREAATNGSPFAMCMCSRLLRTGIGTARSDDDAYMWAQRAAATGFPPGSYELGQCFQNGVGIARDMHRARDLYEQASEGGYGFAAHRLGRACYEGDLGARDLASAVRYMERAADLGESLGALSLAEWYSYGENLRKTMQPQFVGISAVPS
jgi:localization factor PodJL